MVYKRLNKLFMFFTVWKYYYFIPYIFFGIISIISESIIPIIMAFIISFMQIFLCIVAFSIRGITNIIEIKENEILIKKDNVKIFIVNDYELIVFKTRGFWEGLIIEKNNNICKIWKYEFNKNNWLEIKANLIEKSKKVKYDNDFSGLKYDNTFNGNKYN